MNIAISFSLRATTLIFVFLMGVGAMPEGALAQYKTTTAPINYNNTFSPPTVSITALAAPSCSAGSTGQTSALGTQGTYTLTCDGQTRSVVVNVIPNFSEF